MYEHNAASTDQTVDWKNMSKLSFKKKEALTNKVIVILEILFVVVLFTLTFIDSIESRTGDSEYCVVQMTFDLILAGVFILQYISITYQMKKHHHFEYQKSSIANRIFFSLLLVCTCLDISVMISKVTLRNSGVTINA